MATLSLVNGDAVLPQSGLLTGPLWQNSFQIHPAEIQTREYRAMAEVIAMQYLCCIAGIPEVGEGRIDPVEVWLPEMKMKLQVQQRTCAIEGQNPRLLPSKGSRGAPALDTQACVSISKECM